MTGTGSLLCCSCGPTASVRSAVGTRWLVCALAGCQALGLQYQEEDYGESGHNLLCVCMCLQRLVYMLEGMTDVDVGCAYVHISCRINEENHCFLFS